MIVKADVNNHSDIINLGTKYDVDFQKHYDFSLFHSDYRNIYIYLVDNMVVGFCIIENTIDESNLLLIYVDKDYRKKHIATKLMNHYFNNLNSSIKRVLLEVSINNKSAISLYEKLGFKCINVRKNYYKDGSDAMIMERIVNNE